MRKPLVTSLLVVTMIFGAIMVACASEKVELRYALWDTKQLPAMEISIREFERRNPGISVQIELVGWTDYWTRIATGVAAKTLPDVFWNNLGYFPGLVSKGALMDVTDLIERDGVDLDIYYPELVEAWTYQGRNYGLPKDWDTIVVYYNKDMFREAGVPFPSDDWSWNPQDGGDFLYTLQLLTADENGRNATEKDFDTERVVQFGFGGVNADSVNEGWLNFVWMNGGLGLLNEPFGNEFALSEPEAIEALQFYFDLINEYHVAPAADPGIDAIDLFASGKIAMIFAGSWQMSGVQGIDFDWDAVVLPSGPAGRICMFNGLAHNISAFTKHPEEAWELAKWIDSYESQKIVSEMGIVFPAIPELVPVFLKAYEGKNPKNVEAYVKMVDNTGWWPLHMNYTEIADITFRELDLVGKGYATAEEAVANIEMQVARLLRQ